jgi:broad specificity phosphatase PhoE
MRRRGLLAFAGLTWARPALLRAEEAGEQALWADLRGGGFVLLMRHAQTEPGTGDPPSFRLDDCATQRNLDERGRAQARAWRGRFQERRVRMGRIYTSAWCRCRETAELIGGAPIELLPALNSFFEARERREEQTTQLADFIQAWAGPDNLLLVTHQVNITALTDAVPRSAQLVVLSPAAPRAAHGLLMPRT